MDFEKIKELIKLVDASSLAFFELESGNDHIKMDKSLNRGLADKNLSSSNTKSNLVSNTLNSTNSVDEAAAHVVKNEEFKKNENIIEEIVIEDKDIKVIKSPMVGTFYSSASPESPTLAEVGTTISKGKVICIIEAMKLMNEIESDYSGIIIERLVNAGDMVEYGQPLFRVKGE